MRGQGKGKYLGRDNDHLKSDMETHCCGIFLKYIHTYIHPHIYTHICICMHMHMYVVIVQWDVCYYTQVDNESNPRNKNELPLFELLAVEEP